MSPDFLGNSHDSRLIGLQGEAEVQKKSKPPVRANRHSVTGANSLLAGAFSSLREQRNRSGSRPMANPLNTCAQCIQLVLTTISSAHCGCWDTSSPRLSILVNLSVYVLLVVEIDRCTQQMSKCEIQLSIFHGKTPWRHPVAQQAVSRESLCAAGRTRFFHLNMSSAPCMVFLFSTTRLQVCWWPNCMFCWYTVSIHDIFKLICNFANFAIHPSIYRSFYIYPALSCYGRWKMHPIATRIVASWTAAPRLAMAPRAGRRLAL